MTRIKRGVASHARHKKVLRAAKGFRLGLRNRIKLAKVAVIHSLVYAYRDRRTRKREMRALWITRMNAALRQNGTTYSRFVAAAEKKNFKVDRKILAELAVNRKEVFEKIVAEVMA